MPTRRDGESYEGFVGRVMTNPSARQVKIADLEDNINIRRIGQLGPKDLERLEKYHRAWRVLAGGATAGKGTHPDEERTMSRQPKKIVVVMWNQVRVELPAGEGESTRSEVEHAIEYLRGHYPGATEGLPDDTRIVIDSEMSEGLEVVLTAEVSSSSMTPHKAKILNGHEKAGFGALLQKVALMLPEFKRRYCEPLR